MLALESTLESVVVEGSGCEMGSSGKRGMIFGLLGKLI